MTKQTFITIYLGLISILVLFAVWIFVWVDIKAQGHIDRTVADVEVQLDLIRDRINAEGITGETVSVPDTFQHVVDRYLTSETYLSRSIVLVDDTFQIKYPPYQPIGCDLPNRNLVDFKLCFPDIDIDPILTRMRNREDGYYEVEYDGYVMFQNRDVHIVWRIVPDQFRSFEGSNSYWILLYTIPESVIITPVIDTMVGLMLGFGIVGVILICMITYLFANGIRNFGHSNSDRSSGE